jgi:hypothetical protein
MRAFSRPRTAHVEKGRLGGYLWQHIDDHLRSSHQHLLYMPDHDWLGLAAVRLARGVRAARRHRRLRLTRTRTRPRPRADAGTFGCSGGGGAHPARVSRRRAHRTQQAAPGLAVSGLAVDAAGPLHRVRQLGGVIRRCGLDLGLACNDVGPEAVHQVATDRAAARCRQKSQKACATCDSVRRRPPAPVRHREECDRHGVGPRMDETYSALHGVKCRPVAPSGRDRGRCGDRSQPNQAARRDALVSG